MQGDNVWVSKSFEYLNFAIQVFLELLVKTFEFDRLYGDSSFGFLSDMLASRYIVKPSVVVNKGATPAAAMEQVFVGGPWGERADHHWGICPYLMPSHVNCCKTSLANLLVNDELSDCSSTQSPRARGCRRILPARHGFLSL